MCVEHSADLICMIYSLTCRVLVLNKDAAKEEKEEDKKKKKKTKGS